MNWKVYAVILALVAGVVLADEVFQPGSTPTPDTDPVAHYIVSRIYLQTQLMKPNGQQYQESLVKIDVLAQRADGTCARATPAGDCRVFSAEYHGDAATSLLRTLNTANLSTTSLHKRVLLYLQQQGVLPAIGDVVGTPGIDAFPSPTP